MPITHWHANFQRSLPVFTIARPKDQPSRPARNSCNRIAELMPSYAIGSGKSSVHVILIEFHAGVECRRINLYRQMARYRPEDACRYALSSDRFVNRAIRNVDPDRLEFGILVMREDRLVAATKPGLFVAAE